MSPRYEYYALLTDFHPVLDGSNGIVRRWTDDAGQVHDELYSQRLLWESTRDLAMIENGEWQATACPIPEEAVEAYEAAEYARVHADDPLDGEYSYFAQVEDNTSVDNPTSVIRMWTAPNGHEKEQQHIGGPGYAWKASYIQMDIYDGRNRGDLVPVTEEAATRIIESRE
ncbi:hypothetical protein SK854_44665 [Lentzea sp. BCCO 10_0061]|uniref:Uncharacterized protein n=1 Tax=Lentzea sokolovensis TaxID=3095429 RepID=A0ABU4VE54_9PSEU|nr:hypothetical protein [Lentzea sp. BCCO 10_0061]MDX8149281.1 hypothetical protein [Lentzea sp. BCCO 10_0061]